MSDGFRSLNFPNSDLLDPGDMGVNFNRGLLDCGHHLGGDSCPPFWAGVPYSWDRHLKTPERKEGPAAWRSGAKCVSSGLFRISGVRQKSTLGAEPTALLHCWQLTW